MTAPAARTVTQDPLVPGALLCGTEPARLFRSTDEGQSWDEFEGIRALLPPAPRVVAIAERVCPRRRR